MNTGPYALIILYQPKPFITGTNQSVVLVYCFLLFSIGFYCIITALNPWVYWRGGWLVSRNRPLVFPYDTRYHIGYNYNIRFSVCLYLTKLFNFINVPLNFQDINVDKQWSEKMQGHNAICHIALPPRRSRDCFNGHVTAPLHTWFVRATARDGLLDNQRLAVKGWSWWDTFVDNNVFINMWC